MSYGARCSARALALAMLCVLALAGCTATHPAARLRIATGYQEGVYHKLGVALATAWADQLGIEVPEVLPTRGSPDSLTQLRVGAADIAFCAADAAAATLAENGPPVALARIHDDYLHVVVRAGGPIGTLSDLPGHHVSIGSSDSGVEVIARRLLDVAGLAGEDTMTIEHLGLPESLTALREGRIDAFFWSGGIPTDGIASLAAEVPLRLVDLADVLPAMRERYPIYGTASIPASTYGLGDGPVTTLVVPNFLLATDRMPVDVAEALTRGLFDAQPALVGASAAALSIEPRSAIETSPIPLHPGALAYYRDSKI